jgi:hypothetical protein
MKVQFEIEKLIVFKDSEEFIKLWCDDDLCSAVQLFVFFGCIMRVDT